MLHPVSVVVSFSAGFILSGAFALFDHRNPLPQLEAASNSVTVIAQSIDINRSHKGDRLLVRPPDEQRSIITPSDYIPVGKGVSVIDKTVQPPRLKGHDNELKPTHDLAFFAKLPTGCEAALIVFNGQHIAHLIGRCLT